MSSDDTVEDICVKKAESDLKYLWNKLKQKRKIQKMLKAYLECLSQEKSSIGIWGGEEQELETFLDPVALINDQTSLDESQNIYLNYQPDYEYHTGIASQTASVEREMTVKLTGRTD